jgi:hypothetical protein
MEIIFLIPFFILILIAISMMIQGWVIMNERFGYQENPKIAHKASHPEMENYKKGEGLLVVNFEEVPEDNYSELQERINKLKMQELFEEPSTYEDEKEE